MVSSIECLYILSSSMVQTHEVSLHPRFRYLNLCASGWGGDSHLLGFYLILNSALEYIRYLMISSPDVRNMSTIISFFGDTLENFCT